MAHVTVGTGIDLCYDLLGSPHDPAVVLISGLGRPLIVWDDAFCELLVDEGFGVLRFDNRDAGLSTHLGDGPSFDLDVARKGGRDAVAYTLEDMADDTAGLLDAVGIEDGHIVGTSMGGMIAQTLAIRHPARVRSLCSIMSTTGADDVGRPTPEAMAVVTRRPAADREAYLDTELANSEVIGSRRALVDVAWRRGRFEGFYDRGIDPAGTARQIMAIVASGDRTAALGAVTVPTIVIHGDVDTLVPLDAGEATARAIPGAELLVIPDMGHEIPPAAQPEVVAAIVANVRRASGATTRRPGRTPVSGPLEGIRLVELAGIGPGPYTCMLLADAGADVLRVDRATGSAPVPGAGPHWDLLNRSRQSVAVNLKHAEGVRLVLDLVAQADGLVEGWRPGVAERLGIGPDECLARNPRLVYGRMTGWGQDGPLAPAAGHDINYIVLAGALWPIGRAGDRPVPPLNLVGDFGGGGMLLAFGMCAALLEATRSGEGQVVDAAMVDGAASLMTMTFAFRQLGLWTEGRGVNVLDTGAPFYEVYDTSDGKWFSVGAIEPQFYAALLGVLGLDGADLPAQNNREQWPAMKERFAAIFRTRTRDEWTEAFAGKDACGAPVLSPWEAHTDPHNEQRHTFVEVDGVMQPGPVPRFSRTPAAVHKPPSVAGADATDALQSWGIDEGRIEALREAGAVD